MDSPAPAGTPIQAVAPPPSSPPSAPPPPRPTPAVVPPPPAAAPPLHSPSAHPAAFSFEETAAPRKGLPPALIVFIVGVIAVGLAVWYLIGTTGSGALPLPTVSYTAMPGDSKAKGTPVVIKMDQFALFLIDDPAPPGGPGSRTSQIVSALNRSVQLAKQSNEIRYQVDRFQGQAVIFMTDEQKTGDTKELVTITEGDLALAGETDGVRLASQWAERLTDVVRILLFGDPPTFTKGTEFGEALQTMYKAAAGSNRKVTKRSLDAAFQKLMPSQRRALESPLILNR